MKGLFKIQITVKEGHEREFKEYIDSFDPVTIPEGTMIQENEKVFWFAPWPGDEYHTKYDVVDFLNDGGLYEHEHFEVTDEELVGEENSQKATGNVWCPISAGNTHEFAEKMERQFGSNWRDLFNGL